MVQDDKNIFQRAWESTPVQTFFDYPGYIRDEGIQRYMETKEAFNEQGFLGGLGHIGREALSDVVGSPINPANLASSLLTGGRFPNDLAEWIDPSKGTGIGALVENEYEKYRQTYGKDPSMAEKYDIMQNVQNGINPWLAETVPIAGMDVTKRGLIGLPVEGAVLAGEIALTGGMAALAKGLAKKGVREATEKAPQTLAKQFEEGASNVAREATRQALLIPKRIDDVVATTLNWTVGKPLRYGFLAGAKGGKYATDFLFNRAASKASERGLIKEPDTLAKIQQETNDFYGGTYEGNWKNIEDDKEFFEQLGSLGGEPLDPMVGLTAKPVVEQYSIFGNHAPYRESLGKISVWGQAKKALRGEDADELGVDMGKVTKKHATEEEDAVLSRSVTIGGLARAIESALMNKDFWGGELLKGVKGSDPAYAKLLKEYGEDDVEALFFSDDVLKKTGILTSENTFNKYVRIRKPKYAKLLSAGRQDITRVKDVVDETTGEVKSEYFALAGELTGEGYALDDAMKFLDDGTLDNVLKSIKGVVDDDLIKELGAYDQALDKYIVQLTEGGAKFAKGDEISAYDFVRAYTNLAQDLENEAVRLLYAGAKGETAYRILDNNNELLVRGQGGASVPRKTSTKKGDSGEALNRPRWKTNPIGPQAYESTAEAIDDGYRVSRTSSAMIDRTVDLGTAWRAGGVRDFTKEMSTIYGYRHGTLEELVGKQIYQDVSKSYAGIKAILKTVDDPDAKEIIARINEIEDQQMVSKFSKIKQPRVSEQLNDNIRRKDIKDVSSTGGAIRDEINKLKLLTDDIDKLIRTKLGTMPIRGMDVFAETGTPRVFGLTKYQKNEIAENLSSARMAIKNIEADTLDGVNILDGLSKPLGRQVEDYYFPDELTEGMSSYINDVYKTDSAMKDNAFQIVNNLGRTFGATGDFSAVAIQGMIPLLNDLKLRATTAGVRDLGVLSQGDSVQAIGEMFKSFAKDGERISGNFFIRADAHARLNGLGTLDDAIRSNLAFLGNAPDQFVNARQWGVFGRLPGLRNFDRSFAHFGNVIRFQVWDLEMQIRMLEKGMSAKQLVDSGDAAQIAAAVNKMTGVGKRGYGGNVGEFLLFAPRFFKGRLDTLSNALAGTAKGEQATLEQAIARKYMATMIGMSTTLTVGINSALGEETDFVPWKQNQSTGDWYFNPNFMRTHLGDLDISFLGTWDTMLRLASTPAMLVLNQQNDGKFFDGDKMLSDVRGIVSGPLLSKTWDMITGEDAIGQRTTSVLKKDEETGAITEENWFESVDSTAKTLGNVVESLIPFAWDDVAFSSPGRESAIKRTVTGAWDGFAGGGEGRVEGLKDVASGITQGVSQLFGVKSSYETLNELMDEAEAGILELGSGDVRLQEAFGMNEKELGIYLAQHGKGVWDDGKLNIGAGVKGLLTGERTPDFTDIAKDYQKNIQRMQQEGKFPEFFSPEQWQEVEKKYNDKLYNSRDEYSLYSIKRDSLMDQELMELQKLEDAFKQGALYENPITGEKLDTGNMQDLSTYNAMSRRISSGFSELRRNLTDPVNGEFKGLDELFKFGRETALGKISSADADIYDYGQSTYGEKIWGPNGAVMADGDVNWEKREILIEQWAAEMKQKFPSLTDSDVASYLFRIEKKAKSEAPPIKAALLEMTSFIQDSGYYDIERNIFYNMIDTMRLEGAEREALISQYARWKIQNPQDRKSLEESIPLLKDVSDRASEQKKVFRSGNARVDAMLRLVGSSKSKEALSNWGVLVDNAMRENKKKPLSEEKFLNILYDLLNEGVEYKQAYRNFYGIKNELGTL